MIEYDRSYNIIELAYIPEEVENEVVSEVGPNMYAYVGNNPVNFRDPSGRHYAEYTAWGDFWQYPFQQAHFYAVEECDDLKRSYDPPLWSVLVVGLGGYITLKLGGTYAANREYRECYDDEFRNYLGTTGLDYNEILYRRTVGASRGRMGGMQIFLHRLR